MEHCTPFRETKPRDGRTQWLLPVLEQAAVGDTEEWSVCIQQGYRWGWWPMDPTCTFVRRGYPGLHCSLMGCSYL